MSFTGNQGLPKRLSFCCCTGFHFFHMFRGLIPQLSDKYRVIAPDLPGFGFTSSPDRQASTTPSKTWPV